MNSLANSNWFLVCTVIIGACGIMLIILFVVALNKCMSLLRPTHSRKNKRYHKRLDAFESSLNNADLIKSSPIYTICEPSAPVGTVSSNETVINESRQRSLVYKPIFNKYKRRQQWETIENSDANPTDRPRSEPVLVGDRTWDNRQSQSSLSTLDEGIGATSICFDSENDDQDENDEQKNSQDPLLLIENQLDESFAKLADDAKLQASENTTYATKTDNMLSRSLDVSFRSNASDSSKRSRKRQSKKFRSLQSKFSSESQRNSRIAEQDTVDERPETPELDFEKVKEAIDHIINSKGTNSGGRSKEKNKTSVSTSARHSYNLTDNITTPNLNRYSSEATMNSILNLNYPSPYFNDRSDSVNVSLNEIHLKHISDHRLKELTDKKSARQKLSLINSQNGAESELLNFF